MFASDVTKYEALSTACYISAELISELADKELARTKLLEEKRNLIKLSGDLISTGKISIPLFKRILTFLYSACKMSGEIAIYLRDSHKDLLNKMINTLLKKEVNEDYELLAGIVGLICSSMQNLESLDKGVANEVLNILRKIVVKTSPKESFFVKVDNLIKSCDEEKEQEKIEEIRKSLGQGANVWTSEASANSIVLEVLAELFTSEECPEQNIKDYDDIGEDIKMEEEKSSYVETMADILIDKEFVDAIINKCTPFLTEDKCFQLKSLREASNIVKAAEKLRKNAYSCLLNLILNCPKKIGINENIKQLIINSLKEIVSASKANYLKEHISTFVKVSFERLTNDLHLEGSITQSDLSFILTAIQLMNNEEMQKNIISVLGVLLKSITHSLEFNKVSFCVKVGMLYSVIGIGNERLLSIDNSCT